MIVLEDEMGEGRRKMVQGAIEVRATLENKMGEGPGEVIKMLVEGQPVDDEMGEGRREMIDWKRESAEVEVLERSREVVGRTLVVSESFQMRESFGKIIEDAPILRDYKMR